MDSNFTDTLFAIVPYIFGAMLVFVASVWVLYAYVLGKNWSKAKQGGLDPLTIPTDLAVHLLRGDDVNRPGTVAPADTTRTTAERLADLDQLLAQGTISAEEHRAARANIIAGV